MKKLLNIFLILVLMSSCSKDSSIKTTGGSTAVSTPDTLKLSSEELKELKTASSVVYRLPSPTEMALLLHETEAIYDEGSLNNPKSTNLYYTELGRALNLGVYFADLSFTSMFDYPQQAMRFMAAAKGVSEDLNIVDVFNESLMMRLENNLDNKDSIMEIAAFAYMKTDRVLQANDRTTIAKVVLAGAWIEGLYIATRLETSDGKRDRIWSKIGEQQEPLTNLIKMIESCNNEEHKVLLEHLKNLENAFSEVKVNEKTAADGSKQTQVVITNATIEKIITASQLCRSYIVSPN